MTRRVTSAAQCRAARAMLKWTQSRLAAEAGVARKTIAEFEAESRTLHRRTRAGITTALQAAGVEFLWDDVRNFEGVRLHGGARAGGDGAFSADLGRR